MSTNMHQAELETIDDDRTIIRCACGYVAVATVEHLEGDDPEGEVVPFHVDVIQPGEETKVPLRFKDGRPFLGPDGEPVYKTVRPAHPVLLGSSTSKGNGTCRLN
jgi:hypothetical protein